MPPLSFIRGTGFAKLSLFTRGREKEFVMMSLLFHFLWPTMQVLSIERSGSCPPQLCPVSWLSQNTFRRAGFCVGLFRHISHQFLLLNLRSRQMSLFGAWASCTVPSTPLAFLACTVHVSCLSAVTSHLTLSLPTAFPVTLLSQVPAPAHTSGMISRGNNEDSFRNN